MAKGKTTKKKQQEAKQKRDQLLMAVGAVILAIIAFLVFGSNPAENSMAGLPPEINTATGKQMLDEGAFMLDVRNPDEWVEYHVDGATLIPLPELGQPLTGRARHSA